MENRKDTERRIEPSHYVVGGYASSTINTLKTERMSKDAIRHMKHIPYANDFNRGDM